MTYPQARLAALERAALQARDDLGSNFPARVALASTGLDVEEVYCSMRLAESPLSKPDVDALVRRGVAVGGHQLAAYIAVEDYATAARYVQAAFMPGRRHGFIALEEIVGLHARIARRSSERPGNLRETSLRSLPSGMVPPPAWLIPQTLAAYVERIRQGPASGASPLTWAADAHARFQRIRPFESANGRVGRTLLNLLLRRTGFLPFIVRPADAAAYLQALRAADSRDTGPLRSLLARSLSRSYAAASANRAEAGDVRPLSDFAAGRERAALYKAAQRGRLRAFRRDGRLYTSATWIADYKALK